MASRGSRNNILAGVFVLGSVLLATFIVIVLSDLDELLTPMHTYTVQFSLADGAEGLGSGSLVKVGGQPVGRVVGWRFELGPNREPTGVNVEIKVRRDLVLYEDAKAYLVMPLLGSNSQINIPYPGDGSTVAQAQGASPRLEPGETLRGELAAPSFLAQAGYGEEQRRQVQEIIRNVNRAAERIDSIAARVQTELDPTVTQIRGIIDDARAISSDARAQWPTWRDRVCEIVDAVRDAVAEARQVLADNRQRIDSTLRNIEELSAKANTEGWQQVQDLLARGQRGVDEFAALAERANSLMAESAPQLRTIVANARLASDQLKLTSAEVRAAPWKLLSKPTGRKELENEALYDAARQYALAVSDLRAASASLESVTAAQAAADGQPTTPMQREQVDRLLSEVQAAFERYERAERAFLSRLTGRSQ